MTILSVPKSNVENFEAEIKDLNATIETMRQEMNELKQSNADAIEARDKALTAQQLAEMNANQAEQAHLRIE